MDRIVLALATLVTSAGLYLLTAGDLSPAEAIAALGAVVLAGLYAMAIWRVAERASPFRARSILSLVAAAGSIPPDIARVGLALLGALWARPDGPCGGSRHQPLRSDRRPERQEGMAVLALSLAPNGYVLDVGPNGEALLHELHRADREAGRG